MKFTKTFLIILYLIISTSIITVDARIKFAKSMHRYSALLKNSGANDQNLDNDLLKMEEDETKTIFFIIGMFAQIRFMKYQAQFLKSQFEDKKPAKPGCSKEDYLEKYRSFKIDKDAMENIPIANDQTIKVMDQVSQDLGTDSEDLKSVEWDDPRRDCERVVKLYEKKKKEMATTTDISKKYLEFAEKVYNHNETFEEFQEKANGMAFMHRDRIKLKNYILQVYHDDDEEQMKSVYSKNNQAWFKFLENLIEQLQNSMFSAIFHENHITESQNNLPKCEELEAMKTGELMKKKINNFKRQVLGGIEVIKLVNVCTDAKDAALKELFTMGAYALIQLIATLLGVFILKIIHIAVQFFKIGYFISKGEASKNDIEKKYNYYGQAAGVFVSMLLNAIGIY